MADLKPFGMMAPEEIAKKYGGNKQKIAQAAQTGIIPPTEAVLAGMFIDRMRNAASQEAAVPQTVAQQVFAPPQPPAPPPGGPPPGGPGGPPMGGGPGGPPPGGPPMGGPPPGMPPGGPPPMGSAPPMGGPPPGMAGGGLASLPVPDDMFDYADGGLVSFAGGGTADYATFKNSILQQETGGQYGIKNRQGSGARGLGQLMPATERVHAKRLGIPFSDQLALGTSPEAKQYQDAVFEAAAREAWEYGKGDPARAAKYYFAGPDQSKWKGGTAQYANEVTGRMGIPGGSAASEGSSASPAQVGSGGVSEADWARLEPRASATEFKLPGTKDTLSEEFAKLKEDPRYQLPEPDNKRLKEREADLDQRSSPEQKAKDLNYDKSMMLIELGSRIAGSNSPHFLQAVATGVSASLPAAKEARAARKAEHEKILKEYAEIEGITNQQARDKVKDFRETASTELGLKGKHLDREVTIASAQLAANAKLEEQRMASTGNILAGRETGLSAADRAARSSDATTANAEAQRQFQARQDGAKWTDENTRKGGLYFERFNEIKDPAMQEAIRSRMAELHAEQLLTGTAPDYGALFAAARTGKLPAVAAPAAGAAPAGAPPLDFNSLPN